jgi:hypothetical protein
LTRERDAYVNVTHVVATKEARVDWILVGDSVETIPLAVGAKALALADTTTASVNINTRNPDLSIIFGRNGVAVNLLFVAGATLRCLQVRADTFLDD